MQAQQYPPNSGSFAQLSEEDKKKRLDAMVKIWQSDTERRVNYKDETRKELYYKGDKKEEHEIYHKNVFFLKCEELDEVVVKRLEQLAEIDKLLASRIEESLEKVRLQQIQECIPLDAQLRQIDASLKKLTGRLALVSDLVEDEENEAVTTIVNKIQELRGQKRELEEKKKRLGSLEGQEEVRQFYTVLGNFKEKWSTLTLEQKQKLIKLLTTKVEIIPCSMHWYKLTIHWIGVVCSRHDVAYIWRMRPEAQQALEPCELGLIQDHYSSCSMEYLLEKMPNRTWQTIVKGACSLGVQREAGGRRTIPINLAWEDIAFFPDMDKAIAMAKEATEECAKQGTPLYAKWLINLPPTNELAEGNAITHYINEESAGPRNSSGSRGLALLIGSQLV